MVEKKKFRETLQRIKAKNIGKRNFSGSHSLKLNINAEDLSTKGYTHLGRIFDDEKVNRIFEEIKDLKCFDPFRSNLIDFNFKDVPDQVHVANYRRKDLVQIDSIIDIANHPQILTVAQDFLGATPTISNVNMWWSIGGKKEAEQAQLFHRDVDDLKFCKLFIYLTDVEMNNGPHVYVEGSSNSPLLRKIRRYSDDEIANTFGEDKIKYFTAGKGSSFIVDTYGFHKGLLPKDSNRLLLQVQYSLNPIGIESYEPIEVADFKYDKYVNRLLVK